MRNRPFLLLLLGGASAVGVLVSSPACTSFGENASGNANDAGPPNDSGSNTGDSAALGDGSSRFCPSTADPNLECWDFDDGVEPGHTDQEGSLTLDDRVSFSPNYSARVEVLAITTPGERWSYLSSSRTAATSVHLEAKIRLDAITFAELAEVAFEGATRSDRAQLVLSADGSALTVIESTLIDNNTSGYSAHQLGSFSPREWIAIAIDMTVVGMGLPGATRSLRVSVNGASRVDDTGAAPTLESFARKNTAARVGISYTGSSSGMKPLQSLHVDDVLIRFGS